ncbi:MAG: hypothetical protein WBD63_02550 [Phycisphaerae bacterium]|nr:hypothetical protein [Phycisphaerae bacterium]
MGRRSAILLVLSLMGAPAAGCAVPLAVWPTWPTDLGHTLQVRTPDRALATQGYVLVRVYECDTAALAEGERTVRNQQVFDAAFETRSPVDVRPPPEALVKYRLDHVEVLSIGADGTVQVPSVFRPGSLWVVPSSKGAKEGFQRRGYFAEVQALAPGRPPGERREVTLALREVALAEEMEPVRWRRELATALEDIRRGAPEEFVAAEWVEKELAHLRSAAPEAFVPDGVGPDIEHTVPLAPSEADQGLPAEIEKEIPSP